MKILIISQIVDKNDDVLGFMHGWIEGFARQIKEVTVVCLKKGLCALPNNVKILSLSKESGRSRVKYLWNFYKYIWQERKNYDVVFVHMNPEYVLLGGFIWRLFGKKIGLWYAHGYAPWHLRIAEKIVDIIFTSTLSGCRLESSKIKIVGQGIDTDKFRPMADRSWAEKNKNEPFKIITVGRISPVKDYETLIDAAQILKNKGFRFEINIVGGAGLRVHDVYFQGLKDLIVKKDLSHFVNFLGPIPNKDIVNHLSSSDIFVNTSRTGSLDKAILEAMAMELPILTCNEALLSVLGDYVGSLMFEKGNSFELAKKVESIINMSIEERLSLGRFLRELVAKNHGLPKFVEKIVKEFCLKYNE